jgi:hypothetical protein
MMLGDFLNQKKISTERFCCIMLKEGVGVKKNFFSSNHNIDFVYIATCGDWTFRSSKRAGVVAYTKQGKGLQRKVAKKLAKRYKNKMVFVTIRNVGILNSIINFVLSRPTVDKIYFVEEDALSSFVKQIKQK